MLSDAGCGILKIKEGFHQGAVIFERLTVYKALPDYHL